MASGPVVAAAVGVVAARATANWAEAAAVVTAPRCWKQTAQNRPQLYRPIHRTHFRNRHRRTQNKRPLRHQLPLSRTMPRTRLLVAHKLPLKKKHVPKRRANRPVLRM